MAQQTDRQRKRGASEKERVKQKTLLSFCWANSRHVARKSRRGASDINHSPSKCINCVLNDGVNGQRNYVSAQSLTSYQLSPHPACLPLFCILCSALCDPSLSLSHSRSLYLSISLCYWQTTLGLYLPLRVQHATLEIVIESVVWHITYTQRVTASRQRRRERGRGLWLPLPLWRWCRRQRRRRCKNKNQISFAI